MGPSKFILQKSKNIQQNSYFKYLYLCLIKPNRGKKYWNSVINDLNHEEDREIHFSPN